MEARMTKYRARTIAAGLILAGISWTGLATAQVAFPGAEGFGAKATGGRGGRVVKVTNLDADGAGSLQWALDQSGPRIIVFDVSGVIEGDITIPHGDVTIAGQTAPGGGITIAGRLWAEYDESVTNIIVRFVRVRPPPLTGGSDGDQYDAIQFSLNARFIFDHVSVSWASDEVMDLYEADDATIQWSTIEESSTEGHSEGLHNYALLQGPDGYRLSLHHNLFAHHWSRCPAIANGPAEVLNNVIYDVQHGFVHHNDASGSFNIVGNYFRAGPSADLFPFYFDGGGEARYHLRNNYIDDPADFTGMVDDPWESMQHSSFERMDGEGQGSSEPFDFSGEASRVPVTTEDAMEAYGSVLALAGAFPRDAVTRRTVEEVTDRSGEWGARPPADLMEGLTPEAAPVDSDGDGMPDAWETAWGLDPDDDSDSTTVMPSGYTAIEDYVNERAHVLLGGTPSVPDPGAGGTGGGGGSGGAATGGSAGSGPGYDHKSDEASGCACRASRSQGQEGWLVALLPLAGWVVRRTRVKVRTR